MAEETSTQTQTTQQTQQAPQPQQAQPSAPPPPPSPQPQPYSGYQKPSNTRTMAILVSIIVVAGLLFATYRIISNKSKSTVFNVPPKPNTNTSSNTTTTTPVNTSTTNTTTLTNTSTTTPGGTTGPNLTDCLATSPTEPIPNGNFSTGTFYAWNATGGFCSSSQQACVPINLTQANTQGAYYGSPWSNYNGQFFASTYHGGISLVPGNLTSSQFNATEPYLNFKITSPQNSRLYVELIVSNTVVYKAYYDTLNANSGTNPESTFTNAAIPLVNALCKPVSVKVVSSIVGTISTQTQFISVGDFQQSKTPSQTPGILVNQT